MEIISSISFKHQCLNRFRHFERWGGGAAGRISLHQVGPVAWFLFYFVVDVGLKSLQHSSCEQYFGPIPLLQPELFLGYPLLYWWVSFRLKNGTKRDPKVQKKKNNPHKTPHLACCVSLLAVPGCFLVFSSLQMIDLFINSTWGNAIHHQPSVYRHEPIDFFCVYYIKITVNDWEIYRTYILFCYISYIHKYIYQKCLQ